MLRGEEHGAWNRYAKWSPETETAKICEEEYTELFSYLYSKFVSSGIDFCDREISPELFPHETSPGLPFIQYGLKTKLVVWDAYGGDALVEAGEECILRGDAPLYEFAKLEPIKRGKDVRTIMCYPFHVHCALLKYLLAFSEAVKSLHQVMIGWSKWRLGVHTFCESLDREIKYEADARRFDSTLPNCLVYLALDVYFSLWPTSRTAEMRAFIERLKEAITKGLVFSSNGEVYYKIGGNPSGNPVTTELNSVVHLLLLALAYLRKQGTMEGFDDEQLKIYGDDLAGATAGKLNPEELMTLLSDMPVVYPIESVLTKPTMEGLTFLGCTFYKPYKSLPFWLWKPAKPKKMLCTLKYTEKGDSEPDLNLELARVRGILVECAWDREMWNLLYPYQLHLEAEGAVEGTVGKHVDRKFVQDLTFGL